MHCFPGTIGPPLHTSPPQGTIHTNTLGLTTKRKFIAADLLKGFWMEERLIEPKPNQTLWNIFFPDQGYGQQCLGALKRDGYYGDVDQRSAVRPNGRRESIHKV